MSPSGGSGEFGGGGGGAGGAGGFGGIIGALPGLGSWFAGLVQSGFTKFFITNPFQGIEDFFEGKPKTADTIAAALRAAASKNPAVKQFGHDLATLERAGVVLSTDNPTGRAALDKIFAKAMSGLESEGFTKQQAFRYLTNIISSHIAASGGVVPVSPNTGQVMTINPRTPIVPLSTAPPGPPAQGFFPTNSSQDFANQFLTGAQNYIVNAVREFSGLGEIKALTGLQIPTLPEQVDLLNRGVRSLFSGQPTTTPTPAPTPNQPLQIIDPRDCPECNPAQAQIRAQLQGEQQALRQELQTEQQQEQQQKIGQQQKQIQEFRQLERQPVDQRDIESEIQKKIALLDQVGQELQQLQQQIDHGSPSPQPVMSLPPAGGSPPLSPAGGPPQTIEPIGAPLPPPGTLTEQEHEQEEQQIFIQQPPVGAGGDPTKAVKFCVGCVTQDDALKFLNGEPSACSVMSFPG